MKIAITTVAAALFVSIVRATAASETEAAAPVAPRFLSDTGLYSNVAKLTVDPRNRTFSPQYPLWSDGATKRRWVRLPEGSRIDVTDLEKWDLPVGTKFWKEFAFKGRHKELLDSIGPADIRWTCRRLQRITDAQLRDAFRAGGFSPETATRFVRRIRQKVREGLALEPQRQAS